MIPFGLAVSLLSLRLLDVSIPWPHGSVGPPSARVRVVTCNAHGHRLNGSALRQWMELKKPDIVVFQEWTSADQPSTFGGQSWNFLRNGELLVASRFPVREEADLADGAWGVSGAVVSYGVETPGGPIHVIAVHMASPHIAFDQVLRGAGSAPRAIEANSEMRWDQAHLIGSSIRKLRARTIIAGDFNTPTDSPIFADAFGGIPDAFTSTCFGLGYTFDAKWTRTRIDHILFTPDGSCESCAVGPEVGSPHRPVLADVLFPPP